MIDINVALEIRDRALAVVEELGLIVSDVKDDLSEEDLKIITRGVGFSIASIGTELLEPIFSQHPEIDNLKN